MICLNLQANNIQNLKDFITFPQTIVNKEITVELTTDNLPSSSPICKTHRKQTIKVISQAYLFICCI